MNSKDSYHHNALGVHGGVLYLNTERKKYVCLISDFQMIQINNTRAYSYC
jgi:hypothetical protein